MSAVQSCLLNARRGTTISSTTPHLFVGTGAASSSSSRAVPIMGGIISHRFFSEGKTINEIIDERYRKKVNTSNIKRLNSSPTRPIPTFEEGVSVGSKKTRPIIPTTFVEEGLSAAGMSLLKKKSGDKEDGSSTRMTVESIRNSSEASLPEQSPTAIISTTNNDRKNSIKMQDDYFLLGVEEKTVSSGAPGEEKTNNFDRSRINRIHRIKTKATTLQQDEEEDMTMRLWTIPTMLTISRLAMMPLIFGSYYCPWVFGSYAYLSNVITSLIFSFSALTDWLDGVVARLFKQESIFGAWADPVVDKIVVCSTILLLVEKFYSPMVTIPAAIIVGRELGVAGLRELWLLVGVQTASHRRWNQAVTRERGRDEKKGYDERDEKEENKRLSVSLLAKWKTTLQLLSVVVLLYVDGPYDTSSTVNKKSNSKKNTTNSENSTQKDDGTNSTPKDGKNDDSEKEESFWAHVKGDNPVIHISGLVMLWSAALLSGITGGQYCRQVCQKFVFKKKPYTKNV